jgi:hypothetical protein
MDRARAGFAKFELRKSVRRLMTFCDGILTPVQSRLQRFLIAPAVKHGYMLFLLGIAIKNRKHAISLPEHQDMQVGPLHSLTVRVFASIFEVVKHSMRGDRQMAVSP